MVQVNLILVVRFLGQYLSLFFFLVAGEVFITWNGFRVRDVLVTGAFRFAVGFPALVAFWGAVRLVELLLILIFHFIQFYLVLSCEQRQSKLAALQLVNLLVLIAHIFSLLAYLF